MLRLLLQCVLDARLDWVLLCLLLQLQLLQYVDLSFYWNDSAPLLCLSWICKIMLCLVLFDLGDLLLVHLFLVLDDSTRVTF